MHVSSQMQKNIISAKPTYDKLLHKKKATTEQNRPERCWTATGKLQALQERLRESPNKVSQFKSIWIICVCNNSILVQQYFAV